MWQTGQECRTVFVLRLLQGAETNLHLDLVHAGRQRGTGRFQGAFQQFRQARGVKDQFPCFFIDADDGGQEKLVKVIRIERNEVTLVLEKLQMPDDFAWITDDVPTIAVGLVDFKDRVQGCFGQIGHGTRDSDWGLGDVPLFQAVKPGKKLGNGHV